MEPRGMVETQPGPRPAAAPQGSKAPLALSTMALVLAAGGLMGVAMHGRELDGLQAKVASLEAAMGRHEGVEGRMARTMDLLGNAVTLLSDEQVDLSNSKLQRLRHGFAASELRVDRHENGVIVSGRIINATTLRYRGATFRMKVGPSTKEFTLESLPAGASGEFEVSLPNTPLENARQATLSLVTSAVEYDR